MRQTLPSVCPHDCPSQCALSVTVEDGRVVAVTGDAGHPFTQGVVCGKVHDYAERLYAPTRVLTPLRRVGAKGERRFAPITWEVALEEIARRWRGIIAQWGGEAILPYSYAGTLGVLQFWAGHSSTGRSASPPRTRAGRPRWERWRATTPSRWCTPTSWCCGASTPAT